jgi:MinD-like ATPase involved in chromosome partitioning or flagellar assembly
MGSDPVAAGPPEETRALDGGPAEPRPAEIRPADAPPVEKPAPEATDRELDAPDPDVTAADDPTDPRTTVPAVNPKRRSRPPVGSRPAATAVPAAGRSPAVAGPARPHAAPWPWQEPFPDVDQLAAWEEIPVRERLTDRVATVVRGSFRVAVVSLRAGAGRTTITAATGLTLTEVRGEPVVAVDTASSPGADPDAAEPGDGMLLGEPGAAGPLAVRAGASPTADAHVLVSARADLDSLPAVRRLISGTSTGTFVGPGTVAVRGSRATTPGRALATRGGPSASQAHAGSGLDVLPVRGLDRSGLAPLEIDDLRHALTDLAHWYPLVLVDCVAGLDDPATAAVLAEADVIVLVTRATPADLREAMEVVADLGTRTVGTHDGNAGDDASFVPGLVAAVISPRSGRASPRTRRAVAALAGQVDGLVRVPYDSRLAGCATIKGHAPRRRTRTAFLRLAAEVIEACASTIPSRPHAAAGAVRSPQAAGEVRRERR